MGDKPPSRERYEQNNPTVSFRIARKSKEAFDEMVAGMETTKKDWLETVIADGKHQYDAVWNQGHTMGRREGHEKGYEDGYQDAKADYLVVAPCSLCGEPMEVTDETMKDQIYDILLALNNQSAASASRTDLGWTWHHPDCSDT